MAHHCYSCCSSLFADKFLITCVTRIFNAKGSIFIVERESGKILREPKAFRFSQHVPFCRQKANSSSSQVHRLQGSLALSLSIRVMLSLSLTLTMYFCDYVSNFCVAFCYLSFIVFSYLNNCSVSFTNLYKYFKNRTFLREVIKKFKKKFFFSFQFYICHLLNSLKILLYQNCEKNQLPIF